MKRIYILLAFLLALSTSTFAQTPSAGQNYVMQGTVKAAGHKTWFSLTGLPVDSVNRAIQYLDGLGRPLQAVQWQGSPTKKDLVQLSDYDTYGREAAKYLPYAEQTSADGSFKPAAATNQSNFYSTGSGWDANVAKTPQPFSTSIYDHSPLNQVIEQGAPGAAWQPYSGSLPGSGHTMKMVGTANVALDTARLWIVTSTGAQSTANYANGTLYKAITRDENWTSGKTGTIEEFKDKQGRVVLKKIWQDESVSLKTYYVYDDFGNLSYVVPPIFTATSFLESDASFGYYIYGYHYDGRNRLVEKKVPGKGWEYMVYNQLDQVVMTQDSAQRSRAPQEWLVTKYDALGRAVQTGLYKTTDSTAGQPKRARMQGSLDTMLVAHLFESRVNSGVGYTKRSFPIMTTMYTTTYYDNYSNIPGFPVAYNQSASYSAKTKGLPVVTKVNIIASTRYLWTVNYYDDEGQVVKTIQQHYKATSTATTNYDEITSQYNFAHELQTSIRRHFVLGTEQLYVKNTYTYDHQGRKVDTYQTTGSTSATTANSPVLLARQVYNETGQLKDKKLHSTDNGSSFAQDVAYNYNERGWIRSMGSALFDETLKYGETIPGVTPQFNGNISRQEWAGGAHYYNYTYDPLNRLKTAISDAGNNEDIGYDVMGNITRLSRKVGGSLIDQLKYTYANGNQLSAVLDSNTDVADPRFQLAGTTSYTYSGNGELLKRSNTIHTGNNIASISYTYMGMLRAATVGGSALTYTYDALGNKLRKTHSTTDNEYIGGIHYEGGVFAFAQTEAGRVLQNGSGADPAYRYEYTLTDHLGNGRVYFDINSDTARTIQKEDYYAFGLALQSILSGAENKYQYNGKEQQDEVKMYDYGARFYDAVIGRWNATDPLCELERTWSSYNYVYDNPLKFTDPDGMMASGANFYKGEEAREVLKSILDGDPNNSTNQGNGLPGWLQRMLSYFGYNFKGPKDAEEATEQSERSDKLISNNKKIEKKLKIAESIPVAGGILKMSRGAMGNFSNGKEYNQVLAGGGEVLFDVFGGSIIKNGVEVISKDLLGHIFRDAVGHVNPSTLESMVRYLKLFENVVNDTKNINPNILSNYQKGVKGFQGFSQTFKSGKQVWVQTLNGKIINAGVNILAK